MNKVYQRILHAALVFSLLLGCTLSVCMPVSASSPEQMDVHFIDVGQGDATLVTCGGHAMLIDAGDDTKGTAIQNYLQKQKISKLDYLILTHPDADHIGGAPVIITKFDISNVFVSNFEKDNQTYRKLIQSLDDKHIKPMTPSVNSVYSLGSASITILAPGKEYDNPNDASIALLLKNGTRSFLFTGDAGENAEKDILKTNIDIRADVYKVGHHGSKYSTSKDFFKAIDPFYAVISCGEGNSYGHPHAETLNTLRANGVMVYRTDEEGTIIATTDGRSVSFNVPASESWKAGEPTGSSASASAGQPAKAAPAQTTTPAVSGQTEPAAQPQPESAPAVEETPQKAATPATKELTYVLNTKTKKFHKPSCSFLPTTNRQDSTESRDSITAQGYVPCKKCNP
ncbi:MAG: MBL fold metallo-hydrolase [Lachnospiraceae bacterium]|nr:MBL fold metallo-hydrolase [Lachnospiraceae bacterium]